MSYSELINELKLENRVIAATRVKAEDERLSDIAGCVYKALKRVMAGETIVLAAGSCSCKGFDHNSGLKDDRPMIPGGFGLFLSKGSNQRWTPPGERFKCDPRTAEAMFENLPKDVMDGFDAIRLEPYREGVNADVVISFVNADQLSAMIVLHGYHSGRYDTAIATTVSGCASMLRIPFHEMKAEEPRAVITGTDLAQRQFVDEDMLAISVTGKDFERMLSVTGECFFHSPVFRQVRQRLHKDEARPPKFSMLA